MKRVLCVFVVVAICFISLTACGNNSYEKGYRDGFSDGYKKACEDASGGIVSKNDVISESLPLKIIDNDIYELSLIDVYENEESYYNRRTEEDESEECYVFKFQFLNKHESSNIRIALVDASINGYSLDSASRSHSDDSFTVYTRSGNTSERAAVDCFRFFFSDIESATNIRNATNMKNASLSFTFRAYIIDEMDDYGEDSYYTIENAFQYCK